MTNQIPKNWQKVKLGEVVDISSSKRIFAREYTNHGIPFYRGKEIIEKSKGNDVSTGLFIAQEKYGKIKKRFGVPVNGDMLLTSVGTLGIPYIVKENEKFYFKDGNLTWFREFNGLNNKFLYYWIQSREGKEQLNKRIIGSSQQALTIEGLKEMEALLPHEAYQKQTVSVLSAFDNKIEVNNKIAKTLEKMTQTIFKEWFVNKKKEIWKEEGIGNVCETYGGGTPSTKEESYWRDGTIQWATPTDMTGLEGPFIFGTEKKITEKGLKKSSATLLPKGAILMTSRATVGILAISESPISTNQGFISIVCKKPLSNLFVYCWLKHNVRLIQSLATGSTFPEINRSVFRKIRLAVPDKKRLDSFNETVEPMFEKIANLIQESQKLAALRDLLIPKLMKGEITA